MLERKLTIINKLGLHARAAAKFVTLASSFACEVTLAKGDNKVNGKSILGVMMLAASKGTELTLILDGEDETLAAERIQELVENRFDEAE